MFHIKYNMKVKLAVHVVSASCVPAFHYLRISGVKNFGDTKATEIYLQRMNKLIGSIRGKGCKLQ